MNSIPISSGDCVLPLQKHIENVSSETLSAPVNQLKDVKNPSFGFNLSSTTLVDVEISVSSSKREEEDVSSMSVISKSTPGDTVTLPVNKQESDFRHGISRYAPYGTRFAARMKDGVLKTSHIAGDLANRARQKNGRGCRVDLILVTHDGERNQLDKALQFYDAAMKRSGPKLGPSEVLNYLKELGCDWDYRKGDGAKLMQRNASNFFKRMMEHARRVRHPVAQAVPVTPKITEDVNQAAAILEKLMNARIAPDTVPEIPVPSEEVPASSDEMDVEMETSEIQINSQITEVSVAIEASSSLQTSETIVATTDSGNSASSNGKKRSIDWSLPPFEKGSFYYELCRHAVAARREEEEYFSKAAENFDWSAVKQEERKHFPESFDSDDFAPEWTKPRKKLKVKHVKKPAVKVDTTFSGSTASNPQPVIRKGREGLSQGIKIKGLSRHSPYGTRFCAQMPSGEMRESFLAGDLGDRVRSADGKSQGELILVLHPGEIQQLEQAWQFVQAQEPCQVGAGNVLEHLRSLNLDFNHRKSGCRLLQKNAGNFFKRVQEYGRRKQTDPNYLSMPE